MTSFIKLPSGKSVCINNKKVQTLSQLQISIQERVNIPDTDYYLVCDGHRVRDLDQIEDGATYHVVPRLVGGKGGFGSMLRAIGAQIEKTTNREACRDLSGRRMRDVNNEKKLREWVSKKADREKEREERRRQKMERRRSEPRHTFSDPLYEDQKRKVIEGLDDALQEGLKNAGASSTGAPSRKRTSDESGPSSSKKARGWYGDEFDSDDISDDSSDSEMMAQPGPSGSQSDSSSSQPNDKHSDSDVQDDRSTTDLSEPSSNKTSQMETESIEDSKQKNMADNVSTETTTESSDKGTESESLQTTTEERPIKTSEREEEQVTRSANHQSAEKSEVRVPKYQVLQSLEFKVVLVTELQGPVEIDLAEYDSAEALETVGLEALKAALTARGLKCGGALTERAARLFSVKGLSNDEINPSLFSKGGKIKGKGKK